MVTPVYESDPSPGPPKACKALNDGLGGWAAAYAGEIRSALKSTKTFVLIFIIFFLFPIRSCCVYSGQPYMRKRTGRMLTLFGNFLRQNDRTARQAGSSGCESQNLQVFTDFS